jgi:hypothetical protein
MGKTVDRLTRQIDGLKVYVESKRGGAKNPADVDFLDTVVSTLAELNMRVQGLEREIGHSGAFINPNEAPDLPTKII